MSITIEAQILRAYWDQANQARYKTADAPWLELLPAYRNAVAAMERVVDVGRSLTPAKLASDIGSEGLFEAALSLEARGATDNLIRWARSRSPVGLISSGSKPPRQILLEGMYKGATSWWGISAPQGIIGWLANDTLSGSYAASTFVIDSNGWVLAALLKIIAELAIPQVWARMLIDTQALANFDAKLVGSDFDAATRKTLQSLSATATGRLYIAMQVLPIGGLPTYANGSGVATPTLPPPARVPRGPLIAGGALGAFVGIMAQARRGRR